jgi:hypothetical protein
LLSLWNNVRNLRRLILEIDNCLGGNIMSDQETSYNAVERNGVVTAIWEMKGRKHVRTIDPRSNEGKRLLGSYQPSQEGVESTQSNEQQSASQS